MVNTEDFTKRLEQIFDFYGLNASGFADKIGVQRSSLSHLLSGRNKPSLDFILKVLEQFPEVDLYWILNGKGSFPKTTSDADLADNYSEHAKSEPFVAASPRVTPEIGKAIDTTVPKTSNATIDRIVVFYSNGTFSEYRPQ